MGRKPRRDWGSGSIYRTRVGYWRVSIPLPADLGRRRKEWQFRDETAARRYLDRIQYRLRRGLPPEESTVTLRAYAQEWLASTDRKPNTLAMYDSIVRNQLGWLNDYRITRIGAADIRQLLGEREKEGYSGRTRRAILDVLRMILRMAQNDQIVERNAAELVDAPRINAKEPVHWTAEEARRFLDEARGDALYGVYAVALGTGLRRGEVLAIRWDDLHPHLQAVTIRRGKTAAAARVVPLPAFSQAALAGMATPNDDGDARRAGKAHRLHVLRRGPIWPYDPSYVTRHLKVVCERAEVPVLTFHQLRHSTASILADEGVDPELIKQILGHTRVAMTAHYARYGDQMKREAIERLGRAIGG